LEELFKAAETQLGITLSEEEREQVLEKVMKTRLEEEVKAAVAEIGLLEDKVDFGAILALAEPILLEARRLAEWAQDGQLDETGADMLLRIGERWLALESILDANGIGAGNARWCSDDDRVADAASCLHDLARGVRKNAGWFKYLPNITNTCLLSLASDACMGMPHAVFAKRLAVAVELLRTLQLRSTVKGKPGRRGYPLEALKYAQELRKQNPAMKAHVIRRMCLQEFSEDDLPPDGDSFRTWLNRKRTNRTN
jgi:hypothetical protein